MITMCDYYGMCDENGVCVGHPVKVTKEYGRILKSMGEDIRLQCSPCIAAGVEDDRDIFTDIDRLPYDILITGNGIIKRIADKFKLFKNIGIVLKNTGTIFFYQVDFFFFLYILVMYRKSKDRRIVILIYHQDFTGGIFAGILKKIYLKSLDKIDGVVYTGMDAKVPHKNARWMPDFIYNEDEYLFYQSIPKSDRVVALGTMSRYKQLEELLDAWKDIDIPLIIAGRFDTKDRYERLSHIAPDNVTVYDRVLSYDEYMQLLSESKYSILPYDMEQYKSRTSGVLLESIYCGVIPIAPMALLEQNKLPGIGYKGFDELKKILTGNDDVMGVSGMNDFSSIYAAYGMERAKDTLRSMLWRK